MEDNKPKISNLEWGLVIGALLVVDIIQILIEWFLIWLMGTSIIINFFIDVWVGMSLAFYLHWRGLSMASPKRLFSLLATFGLEIIPGMQELPLWFLDGIFNMLIYKGEKAVALVPLAEKAVNVGQKVMSLSPKAKKNITEKHEEDAQKAA